jgi:hypothetical protein
VEVLSRVELPEGVTGPFEVYVNGVPQQPGADFQQRGRELLFATRLTSEGRLGFWRWASLFLGVAGTYRRDDKVDVVCTTRGGRRTVVTLKPVDA